MVNYFCLILCLAVGAAEAHAVGKLNMQDEEFKATRDDILAGRRVYLPKGFKVSNEKRFGHTDEIVCKESYARLKASGEINDEDIALMAKYGLEPRVRRINGKDYFGGFENNICGCFHPATKISVYDSEKDAFIEETALSIYNRPQKYSLITLHEKASPDQFRFGGHVIERMTHGIEALPLVVLHLSNGRTLRITNGHGVLTFSGVMVAAKNLTQTDLLIGYDGRPVKITSIAAELYEGEVLNFQTIESVAMPKAHILFAEGVAVGDLAWQNELSPMLEKVNIFGLPPRK